MYRPASRGGGIDSWSALETVDRYAGKTLSERLTGRFYTPDCLSHDLAQRMLEALDRRHNHGRRHITDPFCGDGRLVTALLAYISEDASLRKQPWRVVLADLEADAVAEAARAIADMAKALRLDVEIVTRVGDTFTHPITASCDLIITNPPWELLKPDTREMSQMSDAQATAYRASLRQVSDKLDADFPNARAQSAWGGWGTNLARCGWDYCLRSSRAGGVVGIILPSTLLGDQTSRKIRETAFSTCTLVDVASYPSEARLFDRVDQGVVALTLKKGPFKSVGRLRLFDAKRTLEANLALPCSAELAAHEYCIPIGFGAHAQGLNARLAHHASLGEREGTGPNDLWMGRELDETRIDEKLVTGLSRPFIKGRMVTRHSIIEAPTQSVRAQLCNGFSSIDKPRAVWRDVSRASQRRRMIGAIIPHGWVAGNSLHVACYRDGNLARTKALHAILSSFALEFQVRSRLATGHMSLGIVRLARAPHLTEKLTAQFARLVDAVTLGDMHAADRLEIAVARAYGLSRNDMITLVDSFPKIDDAEKDRVLRIRHWNKA